MAVPSEPAAWLSGNPSPTQMLKTNDIPGKKNASFAEKSMKIVPISEAGLLKNVII